MRTNISATASVALGLCFSAGVADAAPCSPEPTDMSVGYGIQITCDNSPAADSDFFRFAATAGNRILAEALYISGTSYIPHIELVAPDGTVVGSTWGPARLDQIATQTGTYTAVISALSFTAVGQYSFMVSCLGGTCLPAPPPPPAPPPGANVACEPEPTDFFPGYGTRVTCDIAPDADADLYRFSGSAGDRILADAVFLSGPANFRPHIELVAPDGTVMGFTWGPARLDLVLPQSGTYTAVISALSAAAPGDYAFTVSCLGGSCAPPPGQLPSLTLTLTGCTTCAGGNQFTVQAHFSNPASHTITAELKVGLRLPDGTPANLLGNKHLEFPVPAGLNVTTNLFSFPWPSGAPPGSWTFEATMLGPDLGETFSRSVKTFTVVP